MIFGFDHNSERTLYRRRFYSLSCLMNMVCTGFAFALVPEPGSAIAAIGFLQAAGLLLEIALRRGELSVDQMRQRYVAKILGGMVVIGVSVFLLDREYIIYIPVIMGIVYLNVNTLLRYSFLHYVSVLFMTLTILKAVQIHHGSAKELAEYTSTSVLLVATGLLSFELFRSNKRTYEENEMQAATFRSVSKMLNQLLVHDVNNALTSIFILANEKYRSDKRLFMEELERHVDVVKGLIDARTADHHQAVDVNDLLGQMSVVTRVPNVVFETEITDSLPVVTNRNMLYSTLRNFLQNSVEAAERAGRLCRVAVRKSGSAITIEDDCGGFEVSGIRKRFSSKPTANGHGVFLDTITSPVTQVAFGFRVEISRTRVGTRVDIVFDRVGEPPAAP